MSEKKRYSVRPEQPTRLPSVPTPTPPPAPLCPNCATPSQRMALLAAFAERVRAELAGLTSANALFALDVIDLENRQLEEDLKATPPTNCPNCAPLRQQLIAAQADAVSVREALRPFAVVTESIGPSLPDDYVGTIELTAGQIRAARHALSATPTPPTDAARSPSSPDDLRAKGYTVAVHNDYRQYGEAHTFWLLTHPDGHWLKGEGCTDAEALNQIRAQIQPPTNAAQQVYIGTDTAGNIRVARDDGGSAAETSTISSTGVATKSDDRLLLLEVLASVVNACESERQRRSRDDYPAEDAKRIAPPKELYFAAVEIAQALVPTDAANPWSSRVTDSMNIYAKSGDKVRFAYPDAGYECDREAAVKHLTVGAIYTVERASVGNFHTTVWLQEVPERGFSSVQFADVEPTDAAHYRCERCGERIEDDGSGVGWFHTRTKLDGDGNPIPVQCGPVTLISGDAATCPECGGSKRVETIIEGQVRDTDKPGEVRPVYLHARYPCPTCQPQRKDGE